MVKNQYFEGKPVSHGLAIGMTMRMEKKAWQINRMDGNSAEESMLLLEKTVVKCLEELELTAARTKIRLGEEEGAIFEAHALMLQDPELMERITSMILHENVSAPFAVNEAFEEFIAVFQSIEDEYLRQRAADLADVRDRLLEGLLQVEVPSMAGADNSAVSFDDGFIIIAEDLSPSQVASLDGKDVKGFVLEKGARTSHFTIMANAMGIPTLIHADGVLTGIRPGVKAILDATDVKGTKASLCVEPSHETLQAFQEKLKQQQEKNRRLAQWKDKKTFTADGKHIELSCNIGTEADLDAVMGNGGEGIGLFRTEFLFIDRPTLPTEEEQYKVYKSVLERMDGKRVIIRTMDAGGDKEVGSLDLPKEENPFLGYRAIRICLDQKDLFVTQLRAILRASVHGRAAIMFPMISTLEEWHEAAAIVERVRHDLISEGCDVSDEIELGMMVEIPSVAIQARHFAKEVDFFSIGTNDLTQYTLAVDRGNERVAGLYNTAHPSVLNLIDMTVRAAHDEKKWVGVCGESAGDPDLQRLYAAMGIDELSMSASKVLASRERLSVFNASDEKEAVERILCCGTLCGAEMELEALVSKYSEFSENLL